jgi:hypothetical protein
VWERRFSAFDPLSQRVSAIAAALISVTTTLIRSSRHSSFIALHHDVLSPTMKSHYFPSIQCRLAVSSPSVALSDVYFSFILFFGKVESLERRIFMQKMFKEMDIIFVGLLRINFFEERATCHHSAGLDP